MSSQGVHWFLFDIREVLTLCCTSAGSMGLDVPKTNLVVVNSCPPSAWEFSQQVLFETCSFFNNFWWFLPPRILLAIALFKICLLSLGAREGAVVKLYASTSGGRRRRPLPRWSPSWTKVLHWYSGLSYSLMINCSHSMFTIYLPTLHWQGPYSSHKW